MHRRWTVLASSWRGQPAARTAVLLSFCLGILASSATAAEPVYAKSRRFWIPFQFDEIERQRLGADEIRLFVSRDRGQSWDLADQVAPEKGKFSFEATGDGEYWFSYKMFTRSGLEYPAGPHESQLQVVVDQLPPTLDLELQEVDPGRVRLSWRAVDDHLNVETLELQFREPGASHWQPVAVRAAEEGQTSWMVNLSGTLEVRGSVQDHAGHRGEASREIAISASPEAEQREFLNSGRPIAVTPQQQPGTTANPGIAQSPPDLSPIPAIASDSPLAKLASTPAGNAPVIVPGTSMEPQGIPHAVAQDPGTVQPLNEPPALTPPATTQYPSAGQSGYVVNTRSFRLGYDVEGAGPSGVGRVDLYITEDGGGRWYHYGADPDRQSPVEITVPADGDFGFSFRLANGLGFVAPPPQPGEPPEVLVTVDSTPPVVRLLPLQQGHGPQRDQVLIQWTAQDRRLHETPVRIFYAAHPAGPWEPVQGWQANTGNFLWTVPATLDQQVYLRLEVRDAAGNVRRIELDRPFLVDRSRPRARVTEVEPVHPAQR